MNVNPDMTEGEYLKHLLDKLEEIQGVYETFEQEMIQGDPITPCTKDIFAYVYTLVYDKWKQL